ncbi:hypothetical protein QCA50_012621 [Cerrena zonata]|uniref:Uncharacterized protein n=1 Tax=Cerrena zonata TaxID=2478898 RepID=A0AAW0G414_9APHY
MWHWLSVDDSSLRSAIRGHGRHSAHTSASSHQHAPGIFLVARPRTLEDPFSLASQPTSTPAPLLAIAMGSLLLIAYRLDRPDVVHVW